MTSLWILILLEIELIDLKLASPSETSNKLVLKEPKIFFFLIKDFIKNFIFRCEEYMEEGT